MVVESMTFDELKQFVYDDVYSIMLEDDEVFYSNLDLMKISAEDLAEL